LIEKEAKEGAPRLGVEAALQFLPEGLARVTSVFSANEAANIWRMPPKALLDALDKEKDPENITTLARGLATFSSRIPSLDATNQCRRTAKLLAQKIEKSDSNTEVIAQAMAAVCNHLPPSEASGMLSSALVRRIDPWTCRALAE